MEMVEIAQLEVGGGIAVRHAAVRSVIFGLLSYLIISRWHVMSYICSVY